VWLVVALRRSLVRSVLVTVRIRCRCVASSWFGKRRRSFPSWGRTRRATRRSGTPRTRDWWTVWAESELSKDFTGTDWSFLIDTALMHHAVWAKGQWTLAAELRLRVAKMGATPEDRARLRITFADADEKDEKRAAREAGSVRQRYGGAGRAVGSD
jgi:hypothetical protein